LKLINPSTLKLRLTGRWAGSEQRTIEKGLSGLSGITKINEILSEQSESQIFN